jgi:hypothetical protein
LEKQEITKIRTEISKMLTKKDYKESVKWSWFFEKKNKIDKLLAKPTKESGRRPKFIELEMKKRHHNKYQ